MDIVLRFVTCHDEISAGIRFRENFWCSHVEAFVPAGTYGPDQQEGYLGAHANGGVLMRPVGYDKDIMMKEQLVRLSAQTFLNHSPFVAPDTEIMAKEFYAFLGRHVGEPYDFKSIFGFILPNIELHQKHHIICSALQTLALRQCEWFRYALAEPAHKISPRDLFLMLSSHVDVNT